jgi:hypothetical protein
LAGTRLNPKTVSDISKLKSLTKVALWDTGLSDAEIANLQKSNKNIVFITGFKDDGKPIKLNPPQIKNTNFVFTKPMLLELGHPIKGVDIRYTTDGTDPDSIKSMLYKPGTAIDRNTSIKAKAYKTGWIGSDIVMANFYKSTYTPDSIFFVNGPNERYSAEGAKSLVDKDLGGTNFGNGKWLASQKNMEIDMLFNNPADVHTITLNCMRNIGSQIFFPIAVEIWGGKDKDHLKILSHVTSPEPLKTDAFTIKGVDCKLATSQPVSCLKIIVKPIQQLPSWDPVKKQPGWVFMDEIFLN